MRTTLLTSLSIGATLTLCLMAPTAYAQGSETVSGDEIVVTARQRAESLADAPLTVTALTAQTLSAAGVVRTDQIVGLTPGVALVQSTAEQGDSQVNIRGVNGARDAENSFAFIIDGILYSNPAAFNRELADLQQVEIVKGPQGAIYGRNAAAGAIIVTTRAPSEVFEASANLSYGTENTFTGRGRIAGPVGQNMRGSLAVDFRSTDGFYENSLFTGQDNLDSLESWNLNGRLIIDVSPETSLDLKARYGEVEAGSINFNAAFALPVFGGLFFEDVNERTFVYQNNVPHTNNQEALELSVRLDHEFSFGTLTAWTLFSNIENDLLADGTSGAFGFFNEEPTCIATTAQLFADGVTLPPPTGLGPTPETSLFGPYTPTACDGYQYQVRNQEDLSAEVRLTSRSDQAFRWQAGFYVLDISREVGVATGIDSGGAPPSSLFVPNGQPYATEQLAYDQFDSRVYAAFGQIAYDFTDTVEASLALRYDREEREVRSLVPTGAVTDYIDFDGPPFDGGAPLNPGLDPFLNPAGILPQTESFQEWQPKATLRWLPTEDLTFFASWGVGFKSGGFNNQGSAATIDAFINGPVRVPAGFNPVLISDQYEEETSSAFEVGARADLFGGRLLLEASAFSTTVEDMQFFEFFVGPFGLLRVVSNIDEVQLQGVELGATWRPTDNLMIQAAGAVNESDIEENTSRPETVGNNSPYTPDYTWNLAAQYDRPAFGGCEFIGRVDVRGTGPTWFHVVQDQDNPSIFELFFGPAGRANFSRSQRDSFVLTDLRLALESERFTAAVFGRNIFDEEYVAEVIPAVEFGGAFVSPGAQASYGVEVGFRF